MLHNFKRNSLLFIFIITYNSISKAGDISCLASPFGQSVILQSEREVAIGLQGYGGEDIPVGLVYSESDAVIDLLNPFTNDPRLATVSEWVSTEIDLNGDGKNEIAYAGVNGSSQLIIHIYAQGNVLIDTWSIDNVQPSNIKILASKYIAGDGEKLVIAFSNSSFVTVYGLNGSADGGIAAPNNVSDLIYTRYNTSNRHFSIATGDFLLSGPNEIAGEQIALVIAGEPNGNETIFYDLIRYTGAGDINVTDYFARNADSFRMDAAPLSNDEFVAIKATAGKFGFPRNEISGDQLAIIIQTESDFGGYPLEYWISSFTGARDVQGNLNSAQRISLSHFDSTSGSTLIAQVPEPDVYALTSGDLTRDGFDELILAYPNEVGSQISIKAYRHKIFEPRGLVEVATLGYPLSELPFVVTPDEILDIDVASADLNSDGYFEIVTGFVSNNGYDLVQWNLAPSTAEQIGFGCADSSIIGDVNCPNLSFLPMPDKFETPIAGVGYDFSRFRGQPAKGQWELCIADSANGDFGQLTKWQVVINDDYGTSSISENINITDNTSNFDTCNELTYNHDRIINDIQVNIEMSHTWVGDLTIKLRSPRGSELTLMNRPGRDNNTGFGNNANIMSNQNNPLIFTSFAKPVAIIDRHSNPGTNYQLDSITVALPDWDGDSVFAVLPSTGGLCRNLTEETVNTVIFMPPYFPRIQDSNSLEAYFGQSVSNGDRDSVSTERSSGHEISGYFGASIGGKVLGIGAEASAKVTASKTYESVTGKTNATENEVTISLERSIEGDVVGIANRLSHNYDCFNYNVARGGVTLSDSYTRFCELTADPLISGLSINSWNHNVPTLNEDAPPEWSPIVRDWENIALNATVVSNQSSQKLLNRAVDGDIQSELATDVPLGINDYFIIDLGSEMDISSIRLHTPEDGRSEFLGSLFGFHVYIFSGNQLPSGSINGDIPFRFFNPAIDTGTVLGISTILTVDNNNGKRVPIKGRYIRIAAVANAGIKNLKISELQVFGSGKNTPDKNPVAVCDSVHNDDWFQAKIYSPRINNFTWVDVIGNLDWIPNTGECPTDTINAPEIKTLNFEQQSLSGDANVSWEMDNSMISSVETSSSISHSSRVGAEIDISGGFVVNAIAGAGYAVSSGVSTSNSSELFWSRSVNFGGSIPGISSLDDAAECDYFARPFAYRAPFYGNSGYQHIALMVDYLVKSNTWIHGAVPEMCILEDQETIFKNSFEMN